jgi:predicted nucleotidyltransferase
MAIFSPDERDATLPRLVSLLERDERIEAAVIDGSIGTGRADRWSDLDVAAVVSDGYDCESVAEDWIQRMYRELPVAHHYRTAFGPTIVPGFLLRNGLEIDLSFTPSAEFEVWAPVQIAFDRSGAATRAAAKPTSWSPTPDWSGEAGFAWHDVLHACVAANRGKPWQAVYYLQRVRNRTLSLASERHGWDADEFTRVDELPSAERDPLQASLVAGLDRATLLQAIDVATRAFLAELRRGDPDLAERLEAPLIAFVQASSNSEQSS